MVEWRFTRIGKLLALYALIVIAAAGYALFQHAPFAGQPEIYNYYIIIDEATEEHLMYVPVTVHAGDELLSENNNRYVVTKVAKDIAYAKFIENIAPSEVGGERLGEKLF
ncbi:MAG: stage II sporulation protein P [Sporomusaceae bacterium]|jgi:hypothetical protein|nr:stage II sporulation protein P [Sporomusaceae bacterium]